jgi:predicted nucleotidyltransferase
LDNDAVRAIILRGSYARGDASSYSDLDFTRFVKEPPEESQAKRFTYREGRLISISTRTLDQERKRLAVPEEAVFVVEGLREARVLLDKDGAFEALQQEARAFSWEPLQAAANAYASRQLMLHTEYVHKILRALLLHDESALSEDNSKVIAVSIEKTWVFLWLFRKTFVGTTQSVQGFVYLSALFLVALCICSCQPCVYTSA